MLKPCSLATLLSIFTLATQAQQKEQPILSKSDSALLKWEKKINVKTSALDSASVHSFSKIDSVQKKIAVGEKSFLSVNDKVVITIDSLKPDLSAYQHKLDSVKGKLSHHIDSLKNLNLPTEKYLQLLDSLNNSGPVKDIKEAGAKLVTLRTKMKEPYNKANQSVSNLNSKVNEKLDRFNQAGGNITGGTGMTRIKLPATNASLPNTSLNLNQTNGIKNPLSGGNMPSANLNAPENKLKGNGNTPSFNFAKPKIEIPKVDLQKSFSEVKNVSGKMNGYSKDLKNISSGNPESLNQLSKDAEKQALKLNELKGLNQNQAELSKYQGIMSQAKDADALKALGKQEIQKEAVNHFAGKEQILQQAMNKMTSLKMKYSELSSLKDTLKRRPNTMHGKPFIERIIPGVTMQFISSKDFTMDFNPSLTYRLSGRIIAGAGWVDRIYVANWHLSHGNPVYGVRTFGEFKLKKGFWVRADVEYINAMFPQQNPGGGPTDTGRRHWEWNVATGFKKDFQVFKSIGGNVQTLYRIWSNYDQTPYPDRLIVRMGFEFPMKKKVKGN